jgi:hypothetical protein
MFKSIGSYLVLALGVGLLVYSATRSLDFISLTLPADRRILAWFGLAALDGGLVAWFLCFMFGAKGMWQRGVAILMVVVDFTGCVAMFTLDTLYNTGEAGMTAALSPGQIQTAVLALSGVIALNILGTLAYHLTDPEMLKSIAEEEAFGKVEEAARKQISKNADQLAAELSPIVAGDWMQNTRSKYMASIGAVEIKSGGSSYPFPLDPPKS